MVVYLIILGGDFDLKEIIFVSVILSVYVMFFFLRMSIKQAVFVWLNVFLTALIIYIFVSKNEGLELIIIGTFLAIVIALIFYMFMRKNNVLKFDEPFFEKGYFKIFINGIKGIYSKENKR